MNESSCCFTSLPAFSVVSILNCGHSKICCSGISLFCYFSFTVVRTIVFIYHNLSVITLRNILVVFRVFVSCNWHTVLLVSVVQHSDTIFFVSKTNTLIGLVSFCHYTKLLQSGYIPYVVHYIPMIYFISGTLYFLIPFIYLTYSISLSPLTATNFFSVSISPFLVLFCFDF